MRVGSLCTGIGGLDLAAEAHFGAEMVWCAEWEQHLDPIIQRHFGPVLNLRDLTTVAWDELEPVDILTAGYPCQPFSHAGKRQGADDERHLWPHIIDAVRVLRPGWVVLENVAGHFSLGFSIVLGDLAEAGFDAEWCLLRASDVGAPHQRARLFVVATDARRERHGRGQDTRLVGRVDREDASGARQRQRSWTVARHRSDAAPADADQLATRRVRGAAPGPQEPDAGRREAVLGDGPADGAGVAWGDFTPAIRRWESILGRTAPVPTDAGRLNPTFVEWMMGYPEGWVDGLTRTQALKALGNAVVPQQGYAALRELAPIMERAA